MREKPEWLKVRAPTGEGFGRMRELTRRGGVNTVCDLSHCPNISYCWSCGHASFLILGRHCTRDCAFCAVESGPLEEVDPDEAARIASAVRSLDLRYVVVTSVTRDDLPDQGAGQFAAVVGAIRRENPRTRVELLIPDMRSSKEALSTIVGSRPDVVGHNIEIVPRLQSTARDRRFSYERSLRTLRTVKELDASLITKSSIMLGLGEHYDEVLDALRDLRAAGVEAVTMGQYLRPRGGRLEVAEFVAPDVFDRLRQDALSMGFRHVASAPFVRSSFNAHRIFDNEEGNRAH